MADWRQGCNKELGDIWVEFVRPVVGGIIVACVTLLGMWVVQLLCQVLFPDGGGRYVKYVLELRGVIALAIIGAYALRGLYIIIVKGRADQ